MTKVKTNTFYFINDFKFKHVSFDEVEKIRPFKGENPIIRDKFRKKKSNLKISSRICYFFECLMKYHTHVCFKTKQKKTKIVCEIWLFQNSCVLYVCILFC